MELEVLQFASQKEWEKWLEKNHNKAEGVWLKYAKKNSGETTIQHTEAINVALCWGWIDGLAGSIDDKFWKVRFTPRRPRSVWSHINRTKVEQLIAEGKMMPSGLAQVEAAKADGRWDNAYEGQATAKVPDDFRKALDDNKKAAAFFETLSKSNKYAFIWRLHHVKGPQTRAKNIEKYIEMLAEGQKFH